MLQSLKSIAHFLYMILDNKKTTRSQCLRDLLTDLQWTDTYLAVLLPSPKMKYKLRKTNSIKGNKMYVSQCFRFPSSALLSNVKQVIFFAQFKIIIIKGMEIWVQKNCITYSNFATCI
jgi:hypothetical protein